MCYSDFFFQFLSAINFIEREIKFSFSAVFFVFLILPYIALSIHKLKMLI